MGIEELYKYLPARICSPALKLSKQFTSQVDEIRLRCGLPVSFTFRGENRFIDQFGRLCRLENALCAEREDIDECVAALTRSSVYTYEECIRLGYIPLDGGARAGVCGESVYSPDGARGIPRIDSVSLRVSRFVPEAARDLCRVLRRVGLRGTLVFSPPGGGKTTYLRSAAYLLASGTNALRVGLADERNELFVPEMRGCLIDPVRGLPKANAIELLTRTMSPQVIICDEIGVSGAEELLAAQNSGVCLIASCHGNGFEEIMRRPQIALLVREKVFTQTVRLERGTSFGSVISEI